MIRIARFDRTLPRVAVQRAAYVSPEMYPRPDAWNAYSRGWTEWYLSLSREERNAYEDEFPEPDGWHDFYRFVSNQPR